MLGYEVCEPSFDEMAVTKLKDFLPALDLSFPGWGGCIMCLPDWGRSDVIERDPISHFFTKFEGEPPEEWPRAAMPLPVERSASSEKNVQDGGQIFRVSTVLIPPPHRFSI